MPSPTALLAPGQSAHFDVGDSRVDLTVGMVHDTTVLLIGFSHPTFAQLEHEGSWHEMLGAKDGVRVATSRGDELVGLWEGVALERSLMPRNVFRLDDTTLVAVLTVTGKPTFIAFQWAAIDVGRIEIELQQAG